MVEVAESDVQIILSIKEGKVLHEFYLNLFKLSILKNNDETCY